MWRRHSVCAALFSLSLAIVRNIPAYCRLRVCVLNTVSAGRDATRRNAAHFSPLVLRVAADSRRSSFSSHFGINHRRAQTDATNIERNITSDHMNLKTWTNCGLSFACELIG